LDLLTTWQAWALGLGFGALAGASLAGFAPKIAGVLAFLGLLGAAAALAWSGEPVAVAAARPALVDLVPISGGTFRMGSPESEEGRYPSEGPVHEVRLAPFDCMRFPVTRRLYRQIVGTDPGQPKWAAGKRPVNYVSWLDAVAFCNLLSEREGLTSCYQIDKNDVVTWQRAANGYRLPTEAEWEYACRAGSSTRWSFGDDEASLVEHAWFDGNSADQPQPVGRKKPNAWGLHDMHGNVLEWCWDWFRPYSEAATTDPDGPPKEEVRVLRGGSFVASARDLRSAVRRGYWLGHHYWFVGFRCARGPRRQP
jgi:formylglycine-generating enzyme required for sulfatase activity